MSTCYCSLSPIRFSDLFDGRLEKYGLCERVNDESTEKQRCLTDGDNNFLWVFRGDNGEASYTRYAPNGDPAYIRSVIMEEFGLTEWITRNVPGPDSPDARPVSRTGAEPQGSDQSHDPTLGIVAALDVPLGCAQ